MSNNLIKVLLVDDEPQWIFAVTSSLGSHYSVIPVTSARDIEQTIDANPDLCVAVVDINFAPMDIKRSRYAGLWIAELMKRKRPDIPLIIASAFLDKVIFHERTPEVVEWLGAATFVNKNGWEAKELLSHAIRTLAGEVSKTDTSSKPVIEEDKATKKDTADEIRRVIIEEIDKYLPVKERTVSIPGAGNYELIRPLVGFKREIEERLARFPFDENVFLMMKFRDTNKELGDFIIESLREHGLRGVRADLNEWNITKNVYNPIAVLYCCKYGIALFDEAEEHQAFSPNVAYELGIMHYQNKDCLILKHSSLPQVPFDLVKDLYASYDRDLQVRRIISDWIIQIAARRDVQAP